ncbi:2986_t:CDS:2, partial [Acaulospora colombiana]
SELCRSSSKKQELLSKIRDEKPTIKMNQSPTVYVPTKRTDEVDWAGPLKRYIQTTYQEDPEKYADEANSIHRLRQDMRGAAQECFLEQSLGAKNKPTLIAKIAAQAGWSYGNIVENISDLISRNVFDRSWLTVCQIKHKYFSSIAQYQKSIACEGEVKYGECVGRLNIAENLAKEANKLSNSFVSAFSPTATQTLPPDAATSLQDLTKSNLALITEKKNSATRDNDIIYHEVVPQESVIPPIDKLIAAKPIPIQDLYLPNEIQRVIGPDIFQRLIPLSVHESASLYSEEKAKMVRSETERCDLANGELEAALEYMKLPGALSKFRNNDIRSFSELSIPTSEVKQWAKSIKDEEQKGSIKDLLMTLNSLKGRSKEVLDEISKLLDAEQRDYESLKAKYGDSWSQRPSSSHTTVFHQDLLNHLDALEKANSSDRELLQRIDQAMPDIMLLRNGENSDELEKTFAEALSFVSNIREADSSNLNVGESLLDVDAPRAEEEILFKVNQIDECLSNLHKVRKERMDTLNDLKDKTHQDDISHLLILNKKTQNIEPQLFATELEKFAPYRNRITASIHHQQALLQELTVLYKNLMEDEEARTLQERWDQVERKRKDVCERLRKAKDNYLEVKDGLSKGINFYIDLTDLIESLEKTVQKFVKSRQEERNELVQSIKIQDQQMLKDQLSKVNAPTTAPSNNGNSLYDLTYLVEETSKLSLNCGTQGSNVYSSSINREIKTSNTSTIPNSQAVSSTPSTHVRQDSYPPTVAQSFSNPSAPPRPSAPESPTSYYAPPPSQRLSIISTQSSSAYPMQPVLPPKTQAPPLPPLPTGYNQQNNTYISHQPTPQSHQLSHQTSTSQPLPQGQPYNGQFQSQLSAAQLNYHITQIPPSQQQFQQSSYSRPSSLYGAPPLVPSQPSAQPSNTTANFRYPQSAPQQGSPAQRQSTYDNNTTPPSPGGYASLQQSTYDNYTTPPPLPSGYTSLPSVPQQYQAPQQYPLGFHPQVQRPPSQALPLQQPPVQFQTNSIPPAPLQQYQQPNQPIPPQQGYYQSTVTSQNNPRFQANYMQTAPPQKPPQQNYDSHSLLD